MGDRVRTLRRCTGHSHVAEIGSIGKIKSINGRYVALLFDGILDEGWLYTIDRIALVDNRKLRRKIHV